jgi:hypothetical protein
LASVEPAVEAEAEAEVEVVEYSDFWNLLNLQYYL